jgi:hypothetical protein
MKTTKDYEYSFNHVKQRLQERFNLDIDRAFYDKMNVSIRAYLGQPDASSGVVSFVSADNNGDQEVYTMFIKNQIVKVVYSISKDRITTVLPIESTDVKLLARKITGWRAE